MWIWVNYSLSLFLQSKQSLIVPFFLHNIFKVVGSCSSLLRGFLNPEELPWPDGRAECREEHGTGYRPLETQRNPLHKPFSVTSAEFKAPGAPPCSLLPFGDKPVGFACLFLNSLFLDQMLCVPSVGLTLVCIRLVPGSTRHTGNLVPTSRGLNTLPWRPFSARDLTAFLGHEETLYPIAPHRMSPRYFPLWSNPLCSIPTSAIQDVRCSV